MRRIRIRAFVPALALVLVLAANARADCPEEYSLDGGESAVLVTSYETKEEYWVVLTGGIPGVWVPVKVTATTEIGVYTLSDGYRIKVECETSLDLQ